MRFLFFISFFGGFDTVGVIVGDEAAHGGQRGGLVSVLQVVAGAVRSAVALDVALDSLEDGRAGAINIRFPRVDQGESGVDGVHWQLEPVRQKESNEKFQIVSLFSK